MQNLLPLILIGLIVYLMFSKKGGMGCCGGHDAHGPKRPQDMNSGDLPRNHMEKVIDLRKDEYTVLPSRDDNDREIL